MRDAEELRDGRYSAFELALAALGLPRMHPGRRLPAEQTGAVCLVFCTVPEDRLSLLLAASHLAPGSAFVVDDPSWLETRGEALFLRRGITADAQGHVALVTLETPCRVTYLAQFATSAALTLSARADIQHSAARFAQLEAATLAPTSSGPLLERHTGSKLHTRRLAARSGVFVPRTWAFQVGGDALQLAEASPSIEVLHLPPTFDRDALACFLEQLPVDRFVIKPSGPHWMCSQNVTFETRGDLARAVESFERCRQSPIPIEHILIDERIVDAVVTRAGCGARIRVFVARSPMGRARAAGICCNLGAPEEIVNGYSSHPFSIDALCARLALDPAQQRTLVGDLELAAERVLDAMLAFEAPLAGRRAHQQTDWIGADFIVREGRGRLEPVLIEVNDHDCVSVLQALDATQGRGASFPCLAPWIETMLFRSCAYLARDRTVLFLGAEGPWARAVLDTAARLGVRGLRAPVRGDADAIVAALAADAVSLDGVMSIDSPFDLIAGEVAARLSLPASPVEALRRARAGDHAGLREAVRAEEHRKPDFMPLDFSFAPGSHPSPNRGGSHHQVDLILQRGQPIITLITDRGPDGDGPGGAPSILSGELQRHLGYAASTCCQGAGLTDGGARLHFRLAPLGAELVALHASPAPGLPIDQIADLWDVDWPALALFVAAGLPAAALFSSSPRSPRRRAPGGAPSS